VVGCNAMYQKDQGPGTRDAVGMCMCLCVDEDVNEDEAEEEDEDEDEEEGPVCLALRVKTGLDLYAGARLRRVRPFCCGGRIVSTEGGERGVTGMRGRASSHLGGLSRPVGGAWQMGCRLLTAVLRLEEQLRRPRVCTAASCPWGAGASLCGLG
jgi:hypothetical protein